MLKEDKLLQEWRTANYILHHKLDLKSNVQKNKQWNYDMFKTPQKCLVTGICYLTTKNTEDNIYLVYNKQILAQARNHEPEIELTVDFHVLGES